jgi:hypothetical protein
MEPSRMEHRIAQVERALDVAALAAGLVLRLGWPEWHVALTRPMMLVCAGVALLGAGLARDLARLALGEPRAAAAPDPHPGELRTCLESTLGLGAVAGGLAWRFGGGGSALVAGPVGGVVLALAAVASFGHLTRTLVLVLRHEPGHRNVIFWSPPRR